MYAIFGNDKMLLVTSDELRATSYELQVESEVTFEVIIGAKIIVRYRFCLPLPHV